MADECTRKSGEPVSEQVDERVFRSALEAALEPLRGSVRSVTGPGRSGAVASVYASHFLRVPWLPEGVRAPENLLPVLVIDTAIKTGATLRRAARRAGGGANVVQLAVFVEPPRKRFWYEQTEGCTCEPKEERS